jgi:predicted enzyme related to lactoylglutathione lyase
MMNHHGIVHFEIPANDPDKLAKFYSDLLGWQITKMPMPGGDYYSVLGSSSDEMGLPKERGTINGGLYARQAPDQGPVNYANVESVEDYVKKAEGLGAKVLMGKMAVPGMGWFAQISDPDGNVLGLWQSDTSAA